MTGPKPVGVSGVLPPIPRPLTGERGSAYFVWAFNLQVPSKENYSAVAYFVSVNSIPEESLMEKFLKGDDAYRNSRLKLIANIVKGPWIVKKVVGEQAICIIGKTLSCKYCQGVDFIEIDIDIGSSMVANENCSFGIRLHNNTNC